MCRQARVRLCKLLHSQPPAEMGILLFLSLLPALNFDWKPLYDLCKLVIYVFTCGGLQVLILDSLGDDYLANWSRLNSRVISSLTSCPDSSPAALSSSQVISSLTYPTDEPMIPL